MTLFRLWGSGSRLSEHVRDVNSANANHKNERFYQWSSSDILSTIDRSIIKHNAKRRIWANYIRQRHVSSYKIEDSWIIRMANVEFRISHVSCLICEEF